MNRHNRKTSCTLRGAALCAALAIAAPAVGAPTETLLHSFAGGASDGASPLAGLIADSSGNLYGTTSAGGGTGCFGGQGCGVVFKLSPPATAGGTWTEPRPLPHSFVGGATDGARPAGLMADSSGNLYGTTQNGGTSGCPGLGCGVVFKLSPGGTYSVLHFFAGGANDGGNPNAGLIADSSGNLYGTAPDGGGSGCAGPGCGVVFQLSPSGTLTLPHSFAGGASDGAGPLAGLIADSSGNLYGTTSAGGGPGCGGSGCGVVFKLSPPATAGGTWTETLPLPHSFAGGAGDGDIPFAGLIADSSGNLYGTTYGGGASNLGVVFQLSPPATAGGTWTPTLLYSFAGGAGDGANPQAGLIADSSGNLYGTTVNGGGTGCRGAGCGTVFKLSPPATAGGKWTPTLLHSFAEGPGDGANPEAGLIADCSGNLYGTTQNGGASNLGVVYQLAGTGFVPSCRQCCDNKYHACLDGCPSGDNCSDLPPPEALRCVLQGLRCFVGCRAAHNQCIARC